MGRGQNGKNLLFFLLISITQKGIRCFYKEGCLYGGLSLIQGSFFEEIEGKIPREDHPRRSKESTGDDSTQEIPEGRTTAF